jgi:hypothetical protein
VRVIGNAFQNNQHGNGVYNEYSTDDGLYIGNYFYGTSFASSWSTRARIEDNFFQGGSVTWHNQDVWPYRHSHMEVWRNAFVDVRNSYINNFGVGYGPSNDDESFRNSIVDYNRVRASTNGCLVINGKDRYRTLEEVRAQFGWEAHGEVKPYDAANNDLTPEAMGGGAVTFRVPWGRARTRRGPCWPTRGWTAGGRRRRRPWARSRRRPSSGKWATGITRRCIGAATGSTANGRLGRPSGLQETKASAANGWWTRISRTPRNRSSTTATARSAATKTGFWSCGG